MPSETLGANIQLDISQALGSLQSLSAQMQQFASNMAAQLQRATAAFQALPVAIQQVTQATAQSTQASQQQTQASQQQATSTNQLAAAYLAMAQAINTQTQGYTQAQAAALAFRQQQAALAQATREANAQAREAAALWRQVFAVAGGVGLATSIAGVISSIRDMLTSTVNAAVQMQSLTAAFRAVAGGAAGAARDLAFVRNEANRIGIDFVSAATAFKGLEAAARGTSLEGEKARGVFTAVSEASRVMGLTSDQTKHVLIALEQMLSKGKVSAEELRRQMGNFLPGAFEIAARAMGVTTAELDKMLKTGQILSEDFLPRFGRQLRQELGPGLADAARTAQATFARLGNEIQALSVKVGGGILTLLKPMAEFIATILEKVRKANEQTQEAAGRAGRTAMAGKPTPGGEGAFVAPSGATPQEAQELANLSQRLSVLKTMGAFGPRRTLGQGQGQGQGIFGETPTVKGLTQQLTDEFNALVKTIEARTAYNKQLELSAEETDKGVGGAAIVEAQTRQKKALDALLATAQQLPEELRKAVVISEAFPTLYKQTDEKLAAVRKSAEGLTKALEANPNLRVDPRVQQSIQQHEALAKQFEAEITQQEAIDKAQKDAARSARQWAEELKAVATPTSLTELQQKIAAIQQAMQQPGLLPGQWQELALRMQELQRQADDLIDPLKRLQAEALAGLGDALGGTAEMFKEAATANAAYRDAIDKTNVLLGKGESTFERQRVQLRQQIAAIEAVTGETAKTREALQTNLGKIAEAETKKTENELRKQQRAWERLAQEIERPLASAFEAILSGSEGLFESIKRLFIKLLADLAAAAVARAIVIPVLLKLFGGEGGLLGGGGAGGLGGGTTASHFGQSIQGISTLTGGSGNVSTLNPSSIGSLSQTVANLPLSSIFGNGVSSAAPYTGEGFEAGFGTGQSGTAYGGATVGQALGGIAAGMVVGTMVNTYIYGDNISGAEQIGGTVGGIAGGIVGTYFGGPIGGAAGAFLGSLFGAFVGSLFTHRPDPQYQVTQAQSGQVSFDPHRGLQLTTPFRIEDTRYKDLGAVGITSFDTQGRLTNASGAPVTSGLLQLNEEFSASVNALFTQTIASFRGVAPQIQAALVDPLNKAFTSINEEIRKIKFTGRDTMKNVQEFFTTTLPEHLRLMLQPLTEGVQQINPVVMAFNNIIKQAHGDIVRLQQAAMEQHLSLQTSIVGIQQSQFTPAQTFEAQRAQLAQARVLLENTSPQQRPGLISGMQGLIQQIMQSGGNRDVFGADMGRADAIQDQINALIEQSALTGAPLNMQTLKTLQDELALEQQRQSESAAQLRALQQELIAMLGGLQETSAGAFRTMTDLAAEQAKLANAQITTLVDSLQNLESVPAVVENAMQALLVSQQAMASISTQGQQDINTQTQLALLTGQVEALQNINQVEIASLQVLQQIATSLAFVPQLQSGIAYVPHNQLSYIHRGEAVIPAHQNRGGARSGGNVTIHIHAGELNPKQLTQMVSRELERGGRLGTHRVSVRER